MIGTPLRNIEHFVFLNFKNLSRCDNTAAAVFHKAEKMEIDSAAVIVV